MRTLKQPPGRDVRPTIQENIMSIFGDIANFVSDAASSVADVVGDVAQGAAGLADSAVGIIGDLAKSPLGSIAMGCLSIAFPPLGIATSLANMLGGAIGQAVTQAAQQLTQVAGMPQFIADQVGDLVKDVIGGLTKDSNPACDNAVREQCGGGFEDFAKQFCDSIVDCAAENAGGKKKGAGSWFEALAQALGQALDKQAAEIEKLSSQITDENAKDKPSTMLDLQAASQKMSFMMSTADNIVKTLGETLNQAVRKG
jgi:flagellar hook-basal body complex protein FliE